ncbi:hypothetical protein [Methanohalophilus sp. RSK]|nr:hypothetical protein [Methanohalophilus sp. RSK]
MTQMEAYTAFFGSSHVPAGEYVWMLVVLVIAFLALWQARTWVSKF